MRLLEKRGKRVKDGGEVVEREGEQASDRRADQRADDVVSTVRRLQGFRLRPLAFFGGLLFGLLFGCFLRALLGG